MGGWQASMLNNAISALNNRQDSQCRLAGAQIQYLLNDSRISRWMMEDRDANNKILVGTAWLPPYVLPFSAAAIHLYNGLFSLGQASVNWVVTHEIGHHISGSVLEGYPNQLATLCFGPNPNG